MGEMRILTVDDSRFDRAILGDALREAFPGAEVQEIGGPDALAQALAGDPPDAAVTDYHLGWSDGLRVLRAFRERWPDLPVVMYTGTGNEEVAVQAMKAGVEDYIVKGPHRFAQVALAVRAGIERARQEGRLREAEAARQDAEAALRRLGADLERRVKERTRALQEAVADLEMHATIMSHDLRAPLRAAAGLAQALLEDYAPALDDTARDYLERIQAAAARMDAMIRDLLAYGRTSREELVLHAVSLAAAAQAALAQVEADVRAAGAEVAIEEPLPAVQGHATALVQVVANLLGNAVKFVAPGVKPRVRVRAECRGSAVRLWVEDNGIGIAPEHQERVFGAFERLHEARAYAGTGMGLAIVRRAVARLGGRVGVESEPGGGSRFWVELPRGVE